VVISETAGVIGHVLELFAVTHHCPPHTDVYDDYDRLGHLIDDRARPVTSDVAPASRCPDTPDKDPPVGGIGACAFLTAHRQAEVQTGFETATS
jgi:hypothetical protein